MEGDPYAYLVAHLEGQLDVARARIRELEEELCRSAHPALITLPTSREKCGPSSDSG